MFSSLEVLRQKKLHDNTYLRYMLLWFEHRNYICSTNYYAVSSHSFYLRSIKFSRSPHHTVLAFSCSPRHIVLTLISQHTVLTYALLLSILFLVSVLSILFIRTLFSSVYFSHVHLFSAFCSHFQFSSSYCSRLHLFSSAYYSHV